MEGPASAGIRYVELPMHGEDDQGDTLIATVARNLKRLRTRQGLSLERLAARSGVSRSMLGQIELARSAPSISILWKVARALGVPFSALTTAIDEDGTVVLRADQAKSLTSRDGRFTSRACSRSPPTGRRNSMSCASAFSAMNWPMPTPRAPSKIWW